MNSPPRQRPSAGLDARPRSRPAAALSWLVAAGLDSVIIVADRLIQDLSVSLIVVVFVALVLGTIWRDRAWRWGLAAGAALPATHLMVDTAIHHDPPAASAVMLAAFIPSFVGAYLGAFLNKMVSALFGKEDA